MALRLFYDTYYAGQPDPVACLLADLMAWCEVNEFCVRTIVEDAAISIGFPISEDWDDATVLFGAILHNFENSAAIIDVILENSYPLPNTRDAAVALARDILCSFKMPDEFIDCAAFASTLKLQENRIG